jgi:hypothetical protein
MSPDARGDLRPQSGRTWSAPRIADGRVPTLRQDTRAPSLIVGLMIQAQVDVLLHILTVEADQL